MAPDMTKFLSEKKTAERLGPDSGQCNEVFGISLWCSADNGRLEM